MTKHYLLIVSVVLLSIQQTIAQQVKKPNIIIIFTDDQGYQDLGCYGSPLIKTPHLDQMAREGIRFTDFYVGASVCSASRSSLLTARTALRHKVGNAFFPGAGSLNTNEITIAEMLKGVGYNTACFGKWHLGDDKDSVLPMGQGFDEYFGIPYSNDMYINENHVFANNATFTQGYTLKKAKEDQAIARKLRETKQSFKTYADNGLVDKVPVFEQNKIVEYPANQATLSERYIDRAIQFINKSGDSPFFVYITPAMPHTPLFPSERFKGKSKRGPYGDVIEEIDWNVGRLLKHLKDKDLDENTMVIYASDNGPWLIKGDDGGSAAPLRDGKHTTFDGGGRVPCIMWWPGTWGQGKTSSEIVSTLDFMPTFAHYTGAKLPSVPIDGFNVAKHLENTKNGVERQYFYFTKGIKLSGVRKGDWKYLRHGGALHQKDTDGPELYNLDTDIGEQNNLVKKYPRIVEELELLLRQYESSIK